MNFLRSLIFFLLCSSSLSAGNPKFTISSEAGKTNDEVTVKITVNDFIDIGGIQWTLRWDPTCLQYVSLQDFALPDLNISAFNTSKASQGYITTSWYYQQGTSKNNGDVIFTIKFKLIGADGKSCGVEFSNNPLPIEISDKNAMKCTETITNGKVDIGTVVTPTGLVISAGSTQAAKDQEVCVPVRVSGFKSVNAMQFSMGWDTSKIKFTKIQNFSGLTSFDQSSFNQALVNSGKLVCVWFDQNTTGQTVTDNTALFEICFKYTGVCPGSGTVNFTDDPTKTVFNSTTGALTVTKNSGTITASNCSSALAVSVTKVTHPCPGQNNGGIEISTSGGTGTITYAWTNNSTSQNLSGVGAGSYNVTVRDGSGATATLSAAVTLAALAATSSKTDPAQGQTNGVITLTVTGGNTNYTYLWSNNATTKDINNLAAGSYSYTVTDASNCTVTGTVAIGQGSTVLDIASVTPTNITCTGQSTGAIDITISGGTGPFTYAWTGPGNFSANTEDLNGLKAGTYKVTVKDGANATKTSNDIILTEPATAVKITGRVKSVTIAGNDGEVITTVTGGTPAYQYRWNNGSTNSSLTSLSQGSYSITVTDSRGCTANATFNVGVSAGSECFTSQRVFTPNGDGINELFVINCSETLSNQLLIFNRWNQLVYKAENYSNTWLGTDQQGINLPDGVYFWVLKDTSGATSAVYKGHVTLLRTLN